MYETPDTAPASHPDPDGYWADEMHDRWMHAQHLIEHEGKSIAEAAEESLLGEEQLREWYAEHPGKDVAAADER